MINQWSELLLRVVVVNGELSLRRGMSHQIFSNAFAYDKKWST